MRSGRGKGGGGGGGKRESGVMTHLPAIKILSGTIPFHQSQEGVLTLFNLESCYHEACRCHNQPVIQCTR